MKMEGNMISTSLRVLIVDDYPDAAESMSFLVRYWGHDVRVSGDGRSALEMAASYQPDVVLLDLLLPEINGYEVARRLSRQEGAPKPIVVSLSGQSREEDRRNALEAGCIQHWVKPIEPDDLRQFLEACAAAKVRPELFRSPTLSKP
jgi:two-component system CheB/CheR fusion protein